MESSRKYVAFLSLLLAGLFAAGTQVAATDTPSAVPTTAPIQAPTGAGVFFVSPKDGSTVGTKFAVKFGVKKIKIRPAGQDANDHMSGHHHLIIDGKWVPQGDVLPATDKMLHFGKGQTETTVTLSPGVHTLTLQFADGAHRSYGEPLSQTIHVTVK